jgi:hypothetical protein
MSDKEHSIKKIQIWYGMVHIKFQCSSNSVRNNRVPNNPSSSNTNGKLASHAS